MDDPAQAAAYAGADFEEPHRRIVDRCGAFVEDEDLVPSAIVDLGCGPADITVRLARRWLGASVTAIDAAPPMLSLARRRLEDEGLERRIRLVERRLPDLEGLGPVHDLVFSNSLLHHLADPADLWRAVLALGCPGAAVFVSDLRRPDSLEKAHRLVDDYAEGEPEILRRDFFHSLCAAYRPDEIEEQIERAGLAGRLAVSVLGDRHLTVTGRLGAG